MEFPNLFITERTDLLEEEISSNMLCFSIRELKGFSEGEILLLLKEFRRLCETQLSAGNVKVDLIYYSWVDEQAGQLRCNLINANHRCLPFRSDVESVEKEEIIVHNYLQSDYLYGIPLDEIEMDDDTTEEDDPQEAVKVYRKLILYGQPEESRYE